MLTSGTVRTTLGYALTPWLHVDRTARLVFGDHRLAGKSPEGSRQPGGKT
jgi:hypothetical protein